MEDWYWDCSETLLLVIAYGERGERWECSRTVSVCCDRVPPKLSHLSLSSLGTMGSLGRAHLLMLLREVHEGYCERIGGCNGQGRASSVESIDVILFI